MHLKIFKMVFLFLLGCAVLVSVIVVATAEETVAGVGPAEQNHLNAVATLQEE